MKTVKNAAAIMLLSLASAAPASAETAKIAMIETLSGPFAPIGQNQLRSYQMFAETANQKNWAGAGNKLEFAGFDNKGSPQESLTQLKAAIDQGYRYIVQGNGSGVALALIDAINKHNDRNPGHEVVFLNHAAMDPDLTNSKCSFWHFRFDSNSDMKMEALTTFMATDKSIKKVYIIGQNYSHGQQVSRAAKEMLKRKLPGVQIVGDDLHPLGQVKDFSPYVAKIKAAGADTVITGNWGADLALLIKAAKDADLKANFYTYYAGTSGVPTAMGAGGAEHVRQVTTWHPNTENFSGKEIRDEYRKKYGEDFYIISTYTIVTMLSKAINQAHSVDPVKVAFALEGMKEQSLNGDVEMRKIDHQLQQTLYISTWTKVNGKDVKYDQENTGYGWKTNKKIEAYVGVQPTSCQMTRPSK
jgi:branched-chain amino acid transport system substrate-binding protein